MAANSSVTVSFSSRDFYSNDIPIGYGDDAFQAWMTTPKSPKVVASPRDIGNGSYLAHFHTNNETGTALFFVQRHDLNIPGSPFEVWYGMVWNMVRIAHERMTWYIVAKFVVVVEEVMCFFNLPSIPTRRTLYEFACLITCAVFSLTGCLF